MWSYATVAYLLHVLSSELRVTFIYLTPVSDNNMVFHIERLLAAFCIFKYAMLKVDDAWF